MRVVKRSVLVYLLWLSEMIFQYKNCATKESGTVIDSLMEPGDLMDVSLP